MHTSIPIILHNRLKLPRVSERVLDDHVTIAHDVLLRRQSLLFLLWEVYPPVLGDPASCLCELDDGAFGIEKEQVLSVGDG